jgi:hypothetical protein
MPVQDAGREGGHDLEVVHVVGIDLAELAEAGAAARDVESVSVARASGTAPLSSHAGMPMAATTTPALIST